MENKNLVINISTGTFLRAIFIVLLMVFIFMIRDIVALIILSIVIASGVEPAAAWFQKKRVSRVLAVLFVYLLVFSAIGLVFSFAVPPLFGELSEFVNTLPKYLNGGFEKDLLTFLPTLPVAVSEILLGLVDGIRVYVEKFSGGFLNATSAIFGGVFSFIMVFVLSFYFSVQEKGIENFLRIILPLKYEDYAVDLWSRTRAKLGAWLKGQMLLGVLVGVLVYLFLMVLQVRYAFVLAVIAGLFEIIPIFGPIFFAIPGILIALLQSPLLGLTVAGMYFLVQQFENHLIYPLVIRKVVGVPPILSILAIIVGAKLGGFLGVLLSVPIVTFLVEVSSDIEKKKRPVAEVE